MTTLQNKDEILLINKLAETGLINNVDRHFALLLAKLEKKNCPDGLPLLAALTSCYATTGKHTCLEISSLKDTENIFEYSGFYDNESESELSSQASIILKNININELIKNSVTLKMVTNNTLPYSPLVYEHGRIYLYKYCLAERQLAASILKRTNKEEWFDNSTTVNLDKLYEKFNKDNGPHWQVASVYAAMRNRFTVISGGPGTGKTTVVGVLLALYLTKFPDARVSLCAPTGKAQARLSEAIKTECPELNCSEEIKNKILDIPAATIHRLLKPLPDGTFRHSAENPLHLDLLILDEASMAELLLINNLIQALPAECKIVLLGDPGQLASVETGSVLADICSSSAPHIFSSDFADGLYKSCGIKLKATKTDTPLTDCTIELSHAFRFSENGGIGKLKNDVASGKAEDAFTTLQNNDELPPQLGKTFYGEFPSSQTGKNIEVRLLRKKFMNFIKEWKTCEYTPDGSIRKEYSFASYKNTEDIDEAFRILSAFGIISPLRKGNGGTEMLNTLASEFFGITRQNPHGMPVIITRNDYKNNLFNGDIGIIRKVKGEPAKVWFPDNSDTNTHEQRYRSIPLSYLPEYDYAFAITVHKSQGSGYNSVLFVLPPSAEASRELLYTGITRAKTELHLWCQESSFIKATNNPTKRHSGLSLRLGKTADNVAEIKVQQTLF